MAPIRTLVLALMLASTSVALVAPTVSAHDCEAEDPAFDCGSCRDNLFHDHRYTDGHTYCRSNPLCNTVFCIKRVLP